MTTNRISSQLAEFQKICRGQPEHENASQDGSMPKEAHIRLSSLHRIIYDESAHKDDYIYNVRVIQVSHK